MSAALAPGEAFHRCFGTRAAGRDETAPVILQWLASPLGALVAGVRNEAVVLLEFAEAQRLQQQLPALQRQLQAPLQPGEHPLLRELDRQLQQYFRGGLREFELPLQAPGSPFQQQVWQALRDIPYGQTRSYEELARQLGRPQACRAVGHANGRNRLAILLPCHRVVNKDGALAGYGGGLWRKQRLLQLERATPPP